MTLWLLKAWCDQGGAHIIDSRWFGNQMLSAAVECDVRSLADLVKAVVETQDYDATVSEESQRGVRAALDNMTPDAEVHCALTVRLLHDEPDQARVVPAVPGG